MDDWHHYCLIIAKIVQNAIQIKVNPRLRNYGGNVMKRKHVLILAVSIVMCLSFGTVQAATSISLDPGSITSVMVGDSINLDVVLNVDMIPAGIGFGTLDFSYLSSIVSFDGLTDVGASTLGPPDMNAQDWAFSHPNYFIGGVFADGGSFILGTLSFTADAVGTAIFGVTPDPEYLMSIGWRDGTNAEIDIASFLTNGASVQVNAVPIPSTLLILGSGLVGLVGIGRKKRN